MPSLTRAATALMLVAVLLNGQARLHDPNAARAGGIGPLTTTLAYPEPPLLAAAAAVLDVDTGSWLRLYHADRPLPMASTTKIMTAVLAIQHGGLRDMVRVSQEAAGIGQSTMGLVAGEHVTMHDLLYGMLIPSGNDAAIAIAEHVSGSVTAFVGLMNAEARALRLTHTHYTTPYGFAESLDGDDPGHYSSARDLVLLARYAMHYPLFRQIVGTSHYVVPKTALHRRHDLMTVNYFIQWYPGADGIKPGWTSGAGVCQVIDVHRNGRHFLAAILHTANIYTDARDLMNAALGDFTWAPSGHAGDTPDQVISTGSASHRSWFFPATGHSVTGAFLAYYRARGGYAALGAPQTEAVDVDGVLRQYFTYQVLSLIMPTKSVQPERLGYSALPAPTWLSAVARGKDSAGSRYYAQTGHTVTNRFLKYYLAYGGPNAFGFPISEKREMGGTLVQYFENAELIWHPQPDDYHGYVGVAPLGVRCLVREGLIQGSHLPPALHQPYLPGGLSRPALGNLPSATATARARATSVAAEWTPAATATAASRAAATAAAGHGASATAAAATATSRWTSTAVASATPEPTASASSTIAAATPSPAVSSTASPGSASATASTTAQPPTATVLPGATDTPAAPL